MSVTADMQDVVAAFVASLEANGFSRSDAQIGTGFGDRSVELEAATVVVRITSDRGQWFIELGHREWAEWFDPDVWRACLDDEHPPDEPRSLREQSTYVLDGLARITVVGRSNAPDLLPCLRRAHATRARLRLGF